MRLSTLHAIAEMDAERDRVAAADESLLVIRRANEAAVEMLRREVVGDPVRQYWDQKIIAAYRATASRALTGHGL